MNKKLGWGLGVSVFVAVLVGLSAGAETCVFVAQPDPPPSGPVNYDWFSANNWFTNDPISMSLKHSNMLPASGDTAQINSAVNAAANTIHLGTLILTPNAAVSGGDFICSKLQMRGGTGGGVTSFNTSTVEVLTEMDVFGGSCAFNSSGLNIDFGATCFVGLGGAGQLTLGSSQLFNDGEISLYPNSGSQITGGTNFVNASGATIVGTSNTFVTVSGNFDNSGIVECDSGTLQISATTWSCASGTGIFRTTASNAVISVASSMTIPPNTTNIFEGPGPAQLQNGANVQGTVLVGELSGLSVLGPLQTRGVTADAGILQFAGQLSGTGMVDVVSMPGTPSVLLTDSNVSGSITGLVVNIDAGGQFDVGYNLNSLSLSLNGAIINNSGTTTWGGHGGISMGGNSVFNNLPNALFDSQIQNSSSDGALPGGGAFNNYGRFRKSSGTNVLQLAPDFNNYGRLDLQSGQVQVCNGTISGTLSITIGGTNAGTQYSRLMVGGGVLRGALSISFTNGFQPSAGDVYYIVSGSSFGAVTGTFSKLNGLTASNGIVLVPQYDGFGVSLYAVTNPVLSSLNRRGNQFSLSFPTTSNLTNVVEYTDTLNPPVWKPLATNVGDGTVKSVTDPFATNSSRFYRLRFQ